MFNFKFLNVCTIFLLSKRYWRKLGKEKNNLKVSRRKELLFLLLFHAIFLSTALGYSYLYRSFEPGDESELSDLDKDDHDEISACNNHRVEFDDIEGEDISGKQVNDNQKTNTSKEKIQDSTLNQPAFAKKMKLNDYNYCWCKRLMYNQKILKN